MTKRFYLGLLAGLLLPLSGCGHTAHPPTPKAAAYTKTSSSHIAKNYVFGRIAAINGDQWRIDGIHGNVYTAQVSNVTLYGDMFTPQHRSDFRIGDDVRVAGEFVGTAISATAVEHAVDND
jgi:hypothetical protein